MKPFEGLGPNEQAWFLHYADDLRKSEAELQKELAPLTVYKVGVPGSWDFVHADAGKPSGDCCVEPIDQLDASSPEEFLEWLQEL